MSRNNSIIVTSYNIHKGMSPLNRQVVTQKIGEALRQANPDILCLQEVQGQNLKRMVKYNEYPNQSQHEWFGEYLNLDHSYGKNSEYDNGHHGNAVLSRHPLDPKHNVNITVNKLEQRGVLHCEVHPEGWDKPVIILCAHLNLLENDRQKQYNAIAKYVNDSELIDEDTPLILAGDFNDWKKNSCQKLASELNMTEAFMAQYNKLLPTFPAKLPVLSLDRIYVRNLKVERAWVHKGKPWSQLSDHLPISAELSQLD
ncbi:endonuclease/exonuclease/phosphatase family protein [Psychrobacter sp. FDAARGOS_221]|uniref:endonuclease/exonuclease/phosphatase family protein n=1 Tax=Psychrobacter sp. FDAARGOS_221 TaxID=1975705 RepID=UPI000BB57467|nr:endonuclease/exonuclease/phosphatase family protein [Psychrobacter sp. FDAARGOS_221]PNK60897.1 hypothetical protein A6J60_008410 [Psychrobacter sp. FDAARGOS_221]